MTLINPFIYSRSLTPNEFEGRRAELNRVSNRLVTGQSVAIIGQPHVGKTSLLEFIYDEASRKARFGDQFDNYSFVLIDIQAAQSLQAQKDFWRYALKPLLTTDAAGLCALSEQDGYSNLSLEPVFDALNVMGRRHVVLLDEFDSLLSHRALNTPDFYGGLRTLASRSGGLVLVIGARRPLEVLNQLTQEINPHGSPYFNVFVEIQIGALKDEAFNKLLERGGDVLTASDREYIRRVSGRHPYLAQAAASMLWDAHDDELTGAEFYRLAGQNLYRQTRQHFSDTWNFWTNSMRKAVTAVALAQIPRLLSEHNFKVRELVENFDDYGPELDTLQGGGTLTKNESDEWIIAQEALLWWLADELRRNVRDETAFGDWVRAQEMDNLLTRRDKEQLGGAAKATLSVLGKGATTLIETLAKGFGEALLKK